MIKVLAVSW